MRVAVAAGQLDQAETIALQVEAHGLAIDGHGFAERNVIGQIVLMERDGHGRRFLTAAARLLPCGARRNNSRAGRAVNVAARNVYSGAMGAARAVGRSGHEESRGMQQQRSVTVFGGSGCDIRVISRLPPGASDDAAGAGPLVESFRSAPPHPAARTLPMTAAPIAMLKNLIALLLFR